MPLTTEQRIAAHRAARLLADDVWVETLKALVDDAKERAVSGVTEVDRDTARHQVIALRWIHATLELTADAINQEHAAEVQAKAFE
ncbi:MAG TPA: hypothetical protein VGH84_02730 [Steroidobacteraceae bacterium]|jgi:hypothetical protein